MAGILLHPGALYGSLIQSQSGSAATGPSMHATPSQQQQQSMLLEQSRGAFHNGYAQQPAGHGTAGGVPQWLSGAHFSGIRPTVPLAELALPSLLQGAGGMEASMPQLPAGGFGTVGFPHHSCPPTSEMPFITSTGFTPSPKFTPGVENYDELLKSAHRSYKDGHFSRALSLTHPYFLAYPTSTDVLLLIGAIYYQLRNYEQCIAFNDRCILLDPTMPEAHANMANALQQVGSLDMAIIYYQSALRLKPNFADAYNNMASALVQKGMISQAMECYHSALKLNPSLVDVHNNLGDLWRVQGPAGRQNAEKEYHAALAMDKTYAPAWRGLGDLMREAGNSQQALGLYQEAVRLRPAYAEAYTGMGMCLKELRRLEEAESAYRMVLKLKPNCALSLGNLAGVCYERNNLEAAISMYREAIRLEPNFPEAYNNLGNALREAGAADEAIACYTACIQLQFSPMGLHAPGTVQRLCVAYNNLSGILKMQVCLLCLPP